MNIEKLKALRETHALIKYEVVSCERNMGGLISHCNISVKYGDAVTNFNISADDTQSASYIDNWATEMKIERIQRSIKTVENVFSSFANEQMPDEDTVIWKYMDLSKFMSLLSNRSLWFARLDKNWEVDPFEGKVPKVHWETLVDRISNTNFAPQFVGNGKVQLGGIREEGMAQIPRDELMSRDIELQKNHHESAIYNSYVNCWNVSPHESYHMWKLYCNHHNGIAIKSSIGRLKTSLGENKNYSILGGLVEYLDYEKQLPRRINNYFSHIFCKSMPYSFEDEFRLCLSDFGHINDIVDKDAPFSFDAEEIKSNLSNYRTGYKVELDLDSLIQEVVVSPHSDPWFTDLINSILGENRLLTTALDKVSPKNVNSSTMK
jgi:hypothetical protein